MCDGLLNLDCVSATYLWAEAVVIPFWAAQNCRLKRNSSLTVFHEMCPTSDAQAAFFITLFKAARAIRRRLRRYLLWRLLRGNYEYFCDCRSEKIRGGWWDDFRHRGRRPDQAWKYNPSSCRGMIRRRAGWRRRGWTIQSSHGRRSY